MNRAIDEAESGADVGEQPRLGDLLDRRSVHRDHRSVRAQAEVECRDLPAEERRGVDGRRGVADSSRLREQRRSCRSAGAGGHVGGERASELRA